MLILSHNNSSNYFLQGAYYNNYGLLQSRYKGHFDQNMYLFFFLFACYSSIILNSFSHLVILKLCQHN